MLLLLLIQCAACPSAAANDDGNGCFRWPLPQVLRPFMLRRLKESVAAELPGKEEVVLLCGQSAYQAALAEMVRQQLAAAPCADQAQQQPAATAAADLSGVSKSSSLLSPAGGTKRRRVDPVLASPEASSLPSGGAAQQQPGGGGSVPLKAVNNTVMELRNICNHPFISRLHPPHAEDGLLAGATGATGTGTSLPPLVSLCGKLEVLDRVLVKLAATGHKVRRGAQASFHAVFMPRNSQQRVF